MDEFIKIRPILQHLYENLIYLMQNMYEGLVTGNDCGPNFPNLLLICEIAYGIRQFNAAFQGISNKTYPELNSSNFIYCFKIHSNILPAMHTSSRKSLFYLLGF